MTDRYAVIGNPIEHSLSPLIHSEFAHATGQDIAYGRILAPLDGFKKAALQFRDGGGKGLNVTVPFKVDAFRLATARSIRADSARAVNTLSFGAAAIAGDNTDGIGLVNDLRHNIGFEIRNRRILLMGAGGAARGVLLPLLLEEPSGFVIVNRTLSKAVRLRKELCDQLDAAAFPGPGRTVPAMDVRDYASLQGPRFDIVINATSAGLDDAMPPLPRDLFAPGALAYEMVYGRETPFMKFAAGCGARVADGLGMLVEQAAESFFIWRGVRPATAPVIKSLRARSKQ